MDKTNGDSSKSWIRHALWRGKKEWRIQGEQVQKRIYSKFLGSGGKKLLRLKRWARNISQLPMWKAFFEEWLLISSLDFITANIQWENRWQQSDCASYTHMIYNSEDRSWSAEIWIFVSTMSCNCNKHVTHTFSSVHWGMQKKN